MQLHAAPDGTVATVEVAGDGPGFRPDLLETAFQRFVRGDRVRTPLRSGVGLGLAIVVAHGRVVKARNGPPFGGAVVTTALPFA